MGFRVSSSVSGASGSAGSRFSGFSGLSRLRRLLSFTVPQTLCGGLYRFVGAVGHELLPLVLGGQRQVHRVGRDQIQESVDHPWVEVATATGLDLFESLGQAKGRTVNAVGHHGLEGIGDRDDARTQRDVLALEALRVPGAVIFFVVMPDERGDMMQPLN